jgi:predicted glycoside hydrolase/deacetylase ChbG (UPF0249 family)
MSKRLIVNADDFGRTPGVSRGILRAHREGIVTSTTVMINQPGVQAQLEEALTCPCLGIGLHLVFTSWRPLLPAEAIPGLVDERGMFLDQHTVWARAEEFPVAQLRAELTAQIERFTAAAGRRPDHVDCHHFVHLYPPLFEVYADLAARFRLPLRVPFPVESDFDQAARALPFLEGFPHALVRGMIATNSAQIQARRLAHPDHFLCTFFGREALTLKHLLNLLDTLPNGVCELMCHPGYDDRIPSSPPGQSLATSTYRAEREIELGLLTHAAVRERVKTLGIELVSFGVLA